LRYLDKIWFANRLWPSEGMTSTDTKPEVVFSPPRCHLEKWIWRHISAVGASIWTKFGSLMQNNGQISIKWSKSKPKVDFQYGGRLFFKIGSSYISAINWDSEIFSDTKHRAASCSSTTKQCNLRRDSGSGRTERSAGFKEVRDAKESSARLHVAPDPVVGPAARKFCRRLQSRRWSQIHGATGHRCIRSQKPAARNLHPLLRRLQRRADSLNFGPLAVGSSVRNVPLEGKPISIEYDGLWLGLGFRSSWISP